MFKYYLTRASDYIISAKILVLLAIYSVFTIGIKIDALRSGLSYWEYILLAMQNMRYIILMCCIYSVFDGDVYQGKHNRYDKVSVFF